jgi:hypothetical protein
MMEDLQDRVLAASQAFLANFGKPAATQVKQEELPPAQPAAETATTLEAELFVDPTPEEKQLWAEQEREIEFLETSIEKLITLVDDINIKLPIVPANGSNEERLVALRERQRILSENWAAQENTETETAEDKPKFGTGLAVPLRTTKGTKWVDETGTDIDTGAKLNMSPELHQEWKEKLKDRAVEIADEAIKESAVESHSRYMMTQEDFERESEKDFPVYVLPKQPGPEWNDSILYGPVGDLIRKASEFNESHPAGMLVDFLVSLGSIIGRGPYFTISSTQHFANEFMARVGDSSKSRKGTGRDIIDAIVKMVDPKWHADRIASGFGSGEAIVYQVRDDVTEKKWNPRSHQHELMVVPGVTDKRLCIREGELAAVFVLAGKPESHADVVIRDAWDSKPLRNLVKGRGKDGFSNSAKCEEPHISISGDTTISELRQKMPPGASDNGFGNRFLYVYVYRVKDCPQGSPPLDWTKEALYFHRVVEFAKTIKHVSMSDQARKWWNNSKRHWQTVLTPWFAEILPRVFGCCLGQVG